MAENKEGAAEQQHGVGGTAPTARSGQAKVPAAHRSDEQGVANGSADSRQSRQDGARNLLRRITVNEWLTFLVGVGSLVISYLTYQNAADTSDLKAAVSNLTNLASEARRQADAMQIQAKVMQEQLDQMAAAQRPWLMVSNLSISTIQQFPVGVGYRCLCYLQADKSLFPR